MSNVGVVQVLHKAGGPGEGVFRSGQISVTKVYSPTLLALCGVGGVKFPDKNVI